MGLSMKYSNIMGFTEKSDLWEKGELGQFADLGGGGLGKKEGCSVFEGEGEGWLIPCCTLCFPQVPS